jgi:hypothetical protein
MTRLLFFICLALFSISTVRAAALTADELQRAVEHLEKTSAAFLASTDRLSEAQLKFKPTPGRWSVAEVAEHIASAETFLFALIKDQVMKAPPRTEPADLRQIDDFVLQAISDRTKKAQAPEPLIPKNRFGSIESSRDHFKESRAATLAFLKGTPDLRDHAIDSPLQKKLDAYQWLLFISAHCERHTKQINEVKADPNYPKS